MILISDTQATKKNVEILNYVHMVKQIRCQSNHSPQLFELKKKKQQKKQVMVFKCFLCDIL